MQETEIVESPAKVRPHGQSGLKRGNTVNLTGRPKSLAVLIREKTGNGKLLVEKMLDIFNGDLKVEKTWGDKSWEESPSHKDRIAAAQWLSDRGFGKAVETSINLDVNTDSNALAAVVARQLLNLGAEIPEEPAPPQIEV